MTNRNNEASPLYYSRVAGFGLLLMAILAIFSNFSVFNGLIISDDAATTANNIITNEMLFRSGFISFVIVLILDVLLAWALYVLLKPVNKNLAMLAAWFRLVYTAIFGIALHNFLNVLQLLSGTEYLTVFTTDQLQAQVMLLVNAFNNGWIIGLVFFGSHLFVVGYLIIKSGGYIPRMIGFFLVIASAGYLIDSFAHFLLPNYTDYKTIFLLVVAVPGVIGELSLAFWLLIKGVKVQQRR
ncbi:MULTISPECIES: DUF4386 domain-containing protein [unclassified Peribacillus]|uniref:DUF4386 domain-containing protein n=1 Tax=unclassified Peribacillus TaxID=2675266 RepID=UPI0019125716|nr:MULTISPECIES: DUF4386 domain-containing protein [unclassified Peribacillus]MBK5441793.1 DUF4386 domain-containing protein [Peribacillus sp. TH24]MBK5458289.1 DUF4386 domain-containing protein [Peribacillus sp. TH27]